MANRYLKHIKIKVKDAFDFTTSEIRGIIVLIILVILILVGIAIVRSIFSKKTSQTFSPKQQEQIDAFLLQQDSIKNNKKQKNTYYSTNYNRNYYTSKYKKSTPKSVVKPFYFCPDTMTLLDWKRMGFNEKDAKQIDNYLQHCKRPIKSETIKKIYCIDEQTYSKLEPYICTNLPNKKENSTQTTTAGNKKTFATTLNLNLADSNELQQIPGIGPKTASNIVNYRKRLGGFYKVEQLKEVYGIDSNRFEMISKYFVVDQNNIKKININTADVKTIAKHPYIEYHAAKNIVNYREQHGFYTSVADIKKAVRFYDELYQKIVPYLTIE